MTIKVLFFGATAAETGTRFINLDLQEGTTARSCFDRVLNTYPRLTRHKLLTARNEQYSTGEETLEDGDELAIFTAVSGG